ncbi:Lrp/AsnC family transcriptional regulator [Novispirillum itersonii]|uniref:Lrp/AsnC family transcriptional regulator n=1 Tax=Novispirillum itersonii TaxID=189 RepID=UPI000367C369|nr:Lrp/AsnC family transcriptional regulator [Novispirillum itersonii]
MSDTAMEYDSIDRAIINGLLDGFPLSSRPYADAAASLGITEEALLTRLRSLLERGILTRFGPLFRPESIGGLAILAALSVPAERFDEVTATVNAYPEVAHNYQRDHRWNMWFVVATATPDRAWAVLAEIEAVTGLTVVALPKEHEFFLDLRLTA